MNDGAEDLDQRVRLAAFDFLAQQAQRTSDGVLPRTILATGFTLDRIRVPRISPWRGSSRWDGDAVKGRSR